MTLGKYSEAPADGHLTLEQARKRALACQADVRSGIDPAVKSALERKNRSLTQAEELAAAADREKKSVAALLEAYVADLCARGKERSAYDAENLFANHVTKAFPALAAKPAAHSSPEDWTLILARLAKPSDGAAPKGRTALKLRSYAAAAFKLGLGAGRDPMAPAAAGGFGLTLNPVAAVASTSMARAFNRAGTRVLAPSELKAYMGRLEAVPSLVTRLALQLQLVTGGQRMQQLLRLTAQSIRGMTITLLDSKGRRSQPRTHVLPILPEIEEALSQLDMLRVLAAAPAEAPLFTTRPGTVVNLETISSEVVKISAAMLEAEEISTAFSLRDIRRTCETIMAETLGISKDTRAQLLSHGLSGVQALHYDKGEHFDSKSAALRAWNDYLDELRTQKRASGNVVHLKARSA